MTDQSKAIMSTVVIVACLALLGVMVYLKVPEAGLAAIGVITTIVAWFSRTPDRKDPPPGATAIPLVVAGALLASILACGCSDPPPKLPEPTKEQKEVFAGVTFKGQLLECVDKNDTKATQDACATAVIARWGKDGGK